MQNLIPNWSLIDTYSGELLAVGVVPGPLLEYANRHNERYPNRYLVEEAVMAINTGAGDELPDEQLPPTLRQLRQQQRDLDLTIKDREPAGGDATVDGVLKVGRLVLDF